MLVLALILWAPGVYASLDTSFTACDGGECVGTSTSFDAELNNEIQGSNAADFSLGGVSMSHSILTSGGTQSLKDSFTSASPEGSATAYYNVTNAQDIIAAVNGNPSGIPNPWAWVQLTTHNAERINAGAYASNTLGDKANVSIDILNGSVEGYYAEAGVDGGVWARQEFNFATADKGLIFVDSNSTRAAGDWTDAFTGVLNGTIFGYSSDANAKAYTDFASAGQSTMNLIGEEILTGAGGINRDDDEVSTGAHVVGGLISGYSNSANAGTYSSSGSLSASSLEGEWALARGDASDQGGNRSKAYISVLNGPIGNYGSNVYADSSQTSANLGVSDYYMLGNSMPSGDRILASASSSNSAGDKASTSLIVENGSIFYNYGIGTSASNNYVSASQNAGSISGKKICARANGTDSEGYNAISKMLVKNGTINNYAISTFVENYPWSRNVYAGQSLNSAYWDGVNEGLLSFGAFAFNDSMQADVSMGVLNGSINNYGYYYNGYSNGANANTNYINADQYTNSVSGAEILASANSSNIDGEANTGMHVINGSVGYYNSYANGDASYASANQGMNSVSGDFISFGGFASTKSGYRTISGANVTGNKGYVGYANTYANEYKDDVNVNNYLDIAQGDRILAGWRAGKIGTSTLPEAMPVVEYEATGHVFVLNGSLSNYNSYVSSGATNFYTPYDVYGDGSARGSSDFSAYAEEGAINFGSSSRNKEGDNAVVEATVVNGSAYSYGSGASANSKGADAYIGSSYGDGSMQGDRIDIISEASNGEGDQASGHTWAQNGQVYGYRSSASASLCTAQLQENLGQSNDPYNYYWGQINGDAAGTEWRASNLNGESLSGSVVVNNPGYEMGYEPSLFYNLNKLTQAKKRTLEASQEMNAEGIISSSWSAVDKQGDSVKGEAWVENGYAYFNNHQAVTPFSADATSEWGADGSLVSLDLNASDKRNDLAGVSAGATNGHLSGHANLVARTDSAEASSGINGARNVEDGSVSSGWYAQNNKGDEASGSALVSGGTLAATNWAKATTSGVEGSEELQADADQISFDWNAKNKEGDEAYGWTNVYDGYVEASNSAKAVTTSTTGSEDIELDAAVMESHSWAGNANGHFADTYAARMVDWLPCAAVTEELETLDTLYLKYSSSAKATKTTATASQDISDSVGSFLAGGEAGHVAPVTSLRTVEGDVYDQYAISGRGCESLKNRKIREHPA